MKKRYDSKFKAQVGIQAIKETETMAELSSKFEVHRIIIERWKKVILGNAHELFDSGSNKTKELENNIESLYKKVGMLEVENDWLKKKVNIFDK
jgi:transposase-like protein